MSRLCGCPYSPYIKFSDSCLKFSDSSGQSGVDNVADLDFKSSLRTGSQRRTVRGSLVADYGGGCDGIQVDSSQKCVFVTVFSHCGLHFYFDWSHIAL